MNPIIPGSPRDRTGSTGLLRKALKEIERRWAGLLAEVLGICDSIQIYGQNDLEQPRTLYSMTPADFERFSAALQAAVERWIANGRDPANLFWWAPYDADAVQLGTAQTVTNLTNLSAVYAGARTIETIIYSNPYVTRVAIAQLKSYEYWTGLAAAQKATLSDVIARAVIDGKSPKAARAEIASALDVGKARAAGYAQTDITDTLRQARMAEAQYAMDELGLKIGLLWTSALIPTTRPWHASRNGKVYTPQEVKAFYEVNGNRFRCHCATTEALLDAEGKPILTDSLKAKMSAEKLAWEKDNLGT